MSDRVTMSFDNMIGFVIRSVLIGNVENARAISEDVGKQIEAIVVERDQTKAEVERLKSALRERRDRECSDMTWLDDPSHYRRHGVEGPAPELTPEPDPMAAERAAYERMRPELIRGGELGRFVVVAGGKFVGSAATYEAALDVGYIGCGSGPWLVREVTEKEEVHRI